jgi:hypothetical protein
LQKRLGDSHGPIFTDPAHVPCVAA